MKRNHIMRTSLMQTDLMGRRQLVGERNKYPFQMYYVKYSKTITTFEFTDLSFEFKLSRTYAKKQSQFAVHCFRLKMQLLNSQ